MDKIEFICSLWKELALSTGEAWGNCHGDFSTSEHDKARWVAEDRMQAAVEALILLGEIESEVES